MTDLEATPIDGRVARRQRNIDAVLDVTDPALGSELWLVPRHICPTVNLAEEALIVESDGSCSVVRVTARSHDLLLD